MKKIDQKGFTAFEAVIIVVALVAVGAAGYFAYQARQDKSDYSVNVPKKSSPSAQPSQQAATKYYEVKELGVKFVLPEAVKDLEYAPTASGVEFTTKSLVQKSNGTCNIGTKTYPMGIVERIDKSKLTTNADARWTQRLDGLRDAATQGNAKEFDTFFIYRDGPQSACSNDRSVTDYVSQQMQVLYLAIWSAKEI